MLSRQACARFCAVRAHPAPVAPHSVRLVRLASTSSSPAQRQGAAAADLPKAPPHDKVPFSAPPKDETKGQLGQVFMPDMAEKPTVEPIKIPSAPDSYRTSTSDSTTNSSSEPSSTDLSESKVHTVSAPSTYPAGGPSSMAGSADDTFEGLPGDNELSASANDAKAHTTGPSSSSSSNHDSSSSRAGEPLNHEERMGLVKLGGILFGGFVLSGLTRPFKPEVHHESPSEAAKM
ncbi:hypothetical protein JCM10212_005128 [Sporobolomyces blumeae]